MPTDNRTDRRKFLTTAGAVSTGILGLSGTAIVGAGRSSTKWPIPEYVLTDVEDVVNIVEIPPAAQKYEQAAEEAHVVGVYRVIRKGGDHEIVSVADFVEPIEYDLLTDQEDREFMIENVEQPDISSEESAMGENTNE